MSERTAHLRLKAAFRDLVEAAGGQERAGKITGRSHQTISRYGNAADEDNFAPLDVVLALESETGAAFVTGCLADLSGHVLVGKDAAAAPDAAIGRALGAVAKETGEVLAGLGSALADGELTADEAAQIAPDVREANAALARLETSLNEKARGARPRVVK